MQFFLNMCFCVVLRTCFFPRWGWRSHLSCFSHARTHTQTHRRTQTVANKACGLPQAGRRHFKLKDGLCNISLFFIQYKTTHKTVLSTCCFTWCVVYRSCEWSLVPQALACKIMYFFLGFNVMAVKRGVNPNYTLSQLTTENVPFLSERPFCFQVSAHNQNVCKVSSVCVIA